MKSISRYSAQDFHQTITLCEPCFSHDESWVLFTSDASGVPNVHAATIVGNDTRQLTCSKESTWLVGVFPEDGRFLFRRSPGGNELSHIFVQDQDGTCTDLTPGDRTKAFFGPWCQDNQGFFISTNERDGRYFDLYRYAACDYERETVFENTKGWQIDGISRDGRWLIVNGLLLLDLTQPGAEPRPLPGPWCAFSPHGEMIFYSTDEHGEFSQIWSLELATGRREPVQVHSWDVSSFGFSPSGRYRYALLNEDGQNVVLLRDLREGRDLPLEDLPGSCTGAISFSPSESHLALLVGSDRAAPEMYVLDLRAKKPARRLVGSMSPKISSEHLVDGEVVRFRSYDDLEIPAILYRPHGATADQPAPALIFAHGGPKGPGAQSRKGYNAELQFLVNHGYAILAVNFRGSSGYGKTFSGMDIRRHGDVEVRDCIAGKGYLSSLDWIDKDRIGIMGGSFGGFVVLAALSLFPDAFDLGIDEYGFCDMIRFLTDIPPERERYRHAFYSIFGDPEKDGARLRGISPLLHADQVRRPLLVIQGANDPRVKKVESDTMVAAVRKNGVPVDYLVLEDEGHGVTKRENKIRVSERCLAFLDRHASWQMDRRWAHEA